MSRISTVSLILMILSITALVVSPIIKPVSDIYMRTIGIIVILSGLVFVIGRARRK